MIYVQVRIYIACLPNKQPCNTRDKAVFLHHIVFPLKKKVKVVDINNYKNNLLQATYFNGTRAEHVFPITDYNYNIIRYLKSNLLLSSFPPFFSIFHLFLHLFSPFPLTNLLRRSL